MQGNSANSKGTQVYRAAVLAAEACRYAGQQVLVFSVLAYLCCQKQQAEWTASSPKI